MKYFERSHNGELKQPQTTVVSVLNNNLLIAVRSWSGQDLESTVVDEIVHFLSAADADLEVTTPFEYLESLSTLANKVRIAILLANDAVFAQNKDKYQYGFEISVCYKNQNEVVLASVGRFALQFLKNNIQYNLYEVSGLIDDLTLLPGSLLGIDKVPEVICHSLSLKGLSTIFITSKYNDDTSWSMEINQLS